MTRREHEMDDEIEFTNPPGWKPPPPRTMVEDGFVGVVIRQVPDEVYAGLSDAVYKEYDEPLDWAAFSADRDAQVERWFVENVIEAEDDTLFGRALRMAGLTA